MHSIASAKDRKSFPRCYEGQFALIHASATFHVIQTVGAAAILRHDMAAGMNVWYRRASFFSVAELSAI
ncbi:MAG: hypothetical protein QM744_04255 [Mesorhizobium sp.]